MTSAGRLPMGFLSLATHAARRAFAGRRGLLIVALAGFPVVVAWVLAKHAPRVDLNLFVAVMVMLVIQFVVPLAGLFLGVAVLGDEIEGRTVTYLFTRPLPRPFVFLARYVGVAAAYLLLLLVCLVATALVFRSHVPITARDAALAAGIAGLGFLAYSAFFAALRIFLRQALFLGFVLGFIFEGIVSKLPRSGVSRWSIWHHLALLEMRLFEGNGSDPIRVGPLLNGIAPDETVAGSLWILVSIVVLSLVAGALRVRARETRLANAAT